MNSVKCCLNVNLYGKREGKMSERHTKENQLLCVLSNIKHQKDLRETFSSHLFYHIKHSFVWK